MRWPQGWFEWVRLAGRMLMWIAIITFIGQWIYLFDRCVHDGNGKVSCLGISLFTTYVAWWLYAVIAFWMVVNLLL